MKTANSIASALIHGTELYAFLASPEPPFRATAIKQPFTNFTIPIKTQIKIKTSL
jgi:hypothetical protein